MLTWLLQGLLQAEARHGFEGDGFVYLRNPLWWAGITTCKFAPSVSRCLVACGFTDEVLHVVAIGEVCNFAAYAFAPAILVTPMGALSVLVGAVLGSYFLNESLGTLGKLGSAICLIGAVVIVLHAPPDVDIETVDQILHYAIQPGKHLKSGQGVAFTSVSRTLQLTFAGRIPAICHRGCRLRRSHDLQNCACLRKAECPHLLVYLLYRRLHLRHVHQGFRNRLEAHIRRKQPILPPVDIRLPDPHGSLHPDSDELL